MKSNNYSNTAVIIFQKSCCFVRVQIFKIYCWQDYHCQFLNNYGELKFWRKQWRCNFIIKLEFHFLAPDRASIVGLLTILKLNCSSTLIKAKGSKRTFQNNFCIFFYFYLYKPLNFSCKTTDYMWELSRRSRLEISTRIFKFSNFETSSNRNIDSHAIFDQYYESSQNNSWRALKFAIVFDCHTIRKFFNTRNYFANSTQTVG